MRAVCYSHLGVPLLFALFFAVEECAGALEVAVLPVPVVVGAGVEFEPEPEPEPEVDSHLDQSHADFVWLVLFAAPTNVFQRSVSVIPIS